MKVSIIGGSGFIGTSLCSLLKKNKISFEIIDIKKSLKFPAHFRFADVRDSRALTKIITGNILVNLAAVHRDDIIDKHEYFETNVNGAKNIVEACEVKNIKKIIFTSSVAVYGLAKMNTDEGGEINPFNEYGKTKFEAEKVFERWKSKNKNRSLIIVRPTVVFGEGNRGNVYNLFNQIASKKFVMIGKGNNQKSIAYVKNIAKFLLGCITIEEKNKLIFNYVDKPNMSIRQLSSLVHNKLFNKKLSNFYIPYHLGLLIGYVADSISIITKKKLVISSIRVKKFCSSSSFETRNKLPGFYPDYDIHKAIEVTIDSEFISPKANRQIFYSE